MTDVAIVEDLKKMETPVQNRTNFILRINIYEI